jgi:hypothetical protein
MPLSRAENEPEVLEKISALAKTPRLRSFTPHTDLAVFQ